MLVSSVGAAALMLLGCGSGSRGADRAPGPGRETLADTVFVEDFEAGTLAAWQDGVDPARHRIVRDPKGSQSGEHYLEVTYPAGRDGGWLTHMLPSGYDSVYVSLWVRIPQSWQGDTKLIALYGSRTDNTWSAFGQAGKCPTGTDFFAAMLVLPQSQSIRFYTYYPGMPPEPDGVTCWGRFGDGSETYENAPLTAAVWHQIEFAVKLNTPGRADASQTFWVDGVRRGTWSGFGFRVDEILRLNAVQLTFSRTLTQQPTSQHVDVDHIVVKLGKGP
jgi:hypothetical protein